MKIVIRKDHHSTKLYTFYFILVTESRVGPEFSVLFLVATMYINSSEGL